MNKGCISSICNQMDQGSAEMARAIYRDLGRTCRELCMTLGPSVIQLLAPYLNIPSKISFLGVKINEPMSNMILLRVGH